ncbi:MAG TPA: serine/threonine-protein kinase, partial [Chthoniobacterales bacterium]|nr:serine/threonine-protein kinase [Chthoniobacterales bacterium]
MTARGECAWCLIRLGFDEPSNEVPSSIFGDYEIARREDGSWCELGRGAMGVTYLARDKVLDRSVALKVVELPPAERNSRTVRDRFLREARAAAAFRHPNVAGVFHFGASADGDRCYYAMELVEGETLETLIRRDGPLKVEPALEMAAQVTRALIAAATHGLIHRDLKPSNIMLTRNDAATEELVVKVIDFGLAKAIAESGTDMDLTHGAFLGTPAFASPEQFSGAPADARSDIYSLGVTLWYALTGEVPYGGKTIEEIRRGRSELALPVARLTARKLPNPVVQLLRRILAVDPSERPASARELMKAIEACRARLGYSRPNEWRTWPARRKLVAFAGLLAICGAAFFAFQHSENTPDRSIPASSKSIAVLPFQNFSDDNTNTYFADGVQDEILASLAKIADLKVISRTSVMQFRNVEKRNLRDIAKELGVAHVLEGTVQRAHNRVRVTAQLIDARTDAHIWAEHYDGELADVFAIQSEIAQKIADALRAKLSPSEALVLAAAPTRDSEAYDDFL